MSEQRKTTGTRKRAPKKDTENKTTRTRKKVAEEQAAPVQQNEEAAPDSLKAEEEQTARAPPGFAHHGLRGQVHDRRAWRYMERVTEYREAPTLAA